MKKETREKKFKCPNGLDQFPAMGLELKANCHFFGCLHLINDDCPVLKRLNGGNDEI